MIDPYRPHRQQLVLPNLGDAAAGESPGRPTRKSSGGAMFNSAVQTWRENDSIPTSCGFELAQGELKAFNA